MRKLIALILVLLPLVLSHVDAGTGRVTKLHFYVHEFDGGANSSVYTVAQAGITQSSPSSFGLVVLVDNPVKEGPDIGSLELGRIQGISAFTDLKESVVDMVLNLVFKEGKYKGGTLSIVARNPLLEKVKEVPIIGGTGVFRMATGYAFISTHSTDKDGIRTVYEYHAVVFHPEPRIAI